MYKKFDASEGSENSIPGTQPLEVHNICLSQWETGIYGIQVFFGNNLAIKNKPMNGSLDFIFYFCNTGR